MNYFDLCFVGPVKQERLRNLSPKEAAWQLGIGWPDEYIDMSTLAMIQECITVCMWVTRAPESRTKRTKVYLRFG